MVSHTVSYSGDSESFRCFNKSDFSTWSKASCRNILGYEWGVDLTADYLESLFSLTRTKVEHLYYFKLRSHMAVVKGLTTNDRGWKDYFFFVRLDEASVAEESLPVFRRS